MALVAMETTPQRRPSIRERENLMFTVEPRRTGFTPRPAQNLARRKPPKSTLSLECSHLSRCSAEESAHGHPPLTYKLWLEAGKHEPPFPDRPDSSYNSNVWRNFSKQYGFHTSADGQKVNDMIAAMYPLNIPAPSKVGDNTYGKYLGETPTIRDQKRKRLAIERTNRDIEEFRRLRLRSEMRYPPIDKSGNIKPPLNFKRHAYRFIPPDPPQPEAAQTAPPGETRVDMFGKVVPKPKHQPYLWKLAYKLNNPEFETVQNEQQSLQGRTLPKNAAVAGPKVQSIPP